MTRQYSTVARLTSRRTPRMLASRQAPLQVTYKLFSVMEQDQQFVEFVVKAIVNNPDAVRTERIVDERGVLISLHVDQSDMGYVIGRSGQTARSIRTLLKIVGAKNNARVTLKIIEPEGSTFQRRHRDDDDALGGDHDDMGSSSVDDLSI